MKTKITLIFLISFAAMIIFMSCAASEDTSSGKELVGQIVVVGNEPFTNLALQVDPSTNYVLECNKKTRETLLGNQGKWVKIYFKKIEEKNNLKTIEVERAEILTKN